MLVYRIKVTRSRRYTIALILALALGRTAACCHVSSETGSSNACRRALSLLLLESLLPDLEVQDFSPPLALGIFREHTTKMVTCV